MSRSILHSEIDFAMSRATSPLTLVLLALCAAPVRVFFARVPASAAVLRRPAIAPRPAVFALAEDDGRIDFWCRLSALRPQPAR